MRYLAHTPLIILAFSFACNGDGTGTRDGENNETITSPEPPASDSPETGQPDRSNWQEYTNQQYSLRLQHPPNWETSEINRGAQMHFINVYSERHEEQADLPLSIHADATVSHLSFYPYGIGTELPSGRQSSLRQANTSSPVSFQVDEEQSKVFMLENGQVWGYLLRPVQPPQGWDQGGFIFAQIGVRDFNTRCFDRNSGEEKPINQCEPLMGDRIERHGSLIEEEKQQLEQMLASLRLNAANGADEGQRSLSDLIQIEQPQPNSTVSSPLTVRGKARGYWYHEAVFPIQLRDKEGNLLARTNAKAQGRWMTEDFVPFEASLQFSAPNAGKGQLVFQHANPSGLAENERSYSQTVNFQANQ